MKYQLFYILSLFFCLSSFAQESDDNEVYRDSLGNFSDKLNFYRLRIVKNYHEDKNIYEFFEHYKSGKIAERGFTKDKNKIVLDGAYISYHENDNRKN